MTPLFRKLNLGSHKDIILLQEPTSLAVELEALEGVRIHRNLKGIKAIDFCLSFVLTIDEINAVASAVLPLAGEDAILWFAYPKGTSKKYRCDFNRDKGWDALREAGFDTVRQVAIDEDWSALRFRRVEQIGK